MSLVKYALLPGYMIIIPIFQIAIHKIRTKRKKPMIYEPVISLKNDITMAAMVKRVQIRIALTTLISIVSPNISFETYLLRNRYFQKIIIYKIKKIE
jgi:hypothetical protein